jgi:hypothetical protein
MEGVRRLAQQKKRLCHTDQSGVMMSNMRINDNQRGSYRLWVC